MPPDLPVLEQVGVLVEVLPVRDVRVLLGHPRRHVPADHALVAGQALLDRDLLGRRCSVFFRSSWPQFSRIDVDLAGGQALPGLVLGEVLLHAPCSPARCLQQVADHGDVRLVAHPGLTAIDTVPHGFGCTPGGGAIAAARSPQPASASTRRRASGRHGDGGATCASSVRVQSSRSPSAVRARPSRLVRTSSVSATSTFLTDSRLPRVALARPARPSSTPSASRTSSRSKRRAPSNVLTADQERDLVLLEVVDRREAVLDAAGVQQHDRAQRAVDQVVPEEREPVLPGRAEQVQQQRVVQGDPAEVERHRGRGLARHRRGVVDADRPPRSCRPR